MELIDRFMIWSLKYFDIYRSTARKEFNLTILIYSIVLISFLMLTLDFDRLNALLEFVAREITLPVNQGKLTEQEAMLLVNNLDTSFIPTKALTFFPLLLLPLFIRRINDTILHPAFIAPVVIVFVFDFVKVLFGLDFEFRLYGAMEFYNFCLVSILCFLPSSEK